MRTYSLAIVALTAIFGAGACSEATIPEASNDAINADVAVVVADAAWADVAVMRSELGFAPVGAPGPFGTFGDPLTNGRAFAGARQITYFDASGAEQPAYDALTTAKVHVTLDLDREISRGTWEASILRTRDMVITGLEGDNATRIVNGSGSETVSRSRHSEITGVRTYDMIGSFTHEDVVVPSPGSDVLWPLSGTVHRTISVTIVNGLNGDESYVRDVVVVFNGTQYPVVTVNGEVYEVDLAASEGSCPLRG